MFYQKIKLVLITSLFSILIVFALYSFTLPIKDKGKDKKEKKANQITWRKLDEGLNFASVKAPRKSRVSDNKISILKVDPKFYKLELICSTEFDTIARSAKDWCELKNLAAAVNAGMYNLKNQKYGMGYVRNFNHINNGEFRSVYRAMATFNRKDNNTPEFNIFDLDKENWEDIEPKYNSFLQSIKLIDASKKISSWKKKRRLSCSQIIMATDINGNALFLFTRSPYPLDDFSNMALSLPLDIQRAMYLEGGPETSMYVGTKDTTIEKIGSFVWPGYAHDNNDKLWELPNVIGIKRR